MTITDASRRLGVRGVLVVGAVFAAACAALFAARLRIGFPIGLDGADARIGNAGLAVQLVVMVLGVIAIHLARDRHARAILIAEGALCLLGQGGAGVIAAAGILAWYGILSARWLGRGRIIVAGLALVAMNACAFAGESIAANAYVFSMMFSLRMMMYGYDRWQNELERPPLGEYLAYMLPAPLVVMPPYMLIIPVYADFARRFQPGLSTARLRQIARHLALAVAFGALRGCAELSLYEAIGPAWMYWNLMLSVLAAASYAHLFIALLQLHGIDERLPLVRPLFVTRFMDYWGRYQVHQKDAQVFLFYTPALLLLRRWNRYAAIALAVTWTMIVGNTVLHVASRYCFRPGLWQHVQWILVVNAVMAAALATELCLDERRRRQRAANGAGLPLWRRWLGWAITMTLAAIAST